MGTGRAHADEFRQWIRDSFTRQQYFSTGRTYINFQTADEDSARVRAAYGINYDRLVELKKIYDPSNLFRSNCNIPQPRTGRYESRRETLTGGQTKGALSWAQRWNAYRSTASSWSSAARARVRRWRWLLAVVNPQQYIDVVGPSVEKYRAGNRMAAVDGFFSSVFGPDWRAEVSRTVPGGPEQADKDGAALFESDLPSLQEFTEFRDLFHAWLPHTEGDVMPGANHLLHMRHPADAAARLANFLKRHTVAV